MNPMHMRMPSVYALRLILSCDECGFTFGLSTVVFILFSNQLSSRAGVPLFKSLLIKQA